MIKDTITTGWLNDIWAVGRVWALTSRMSGSICTILPPNSPSCAELADAESNSEWWWGGYGGTASSYHTGGVNCAFSDGSVHFISETISTETTTTGLTTWGRYIIDNRGKSPYGVWGAIGSRNGGDSVSF